MGQFLEYEDIEPIAPDLPVGTAEFYIELAETKAEFEAPCITEDGFPYGAMVKAILLSVILKWHHNGPGAATTTNFTAGPFGMANTVDTRTVSGYTFSTADKRDLRTLCQRWKGDGKTRRRAWSYVPGRGVL